MMKLKRPVAALLAAVAVSIQTAELLLALFPVERALKKKFQKYPTKPIAKLTINCT